MSAQGVFAPIGVRPAVDWGDSKIQFQMLEFRDAGEVQQKLQFRVWIKGWAPVWGGDPPPDRWGEWQDVPIVVEGAGDTK